LAVKIRLKRIGRKNRAFYRLVIANESFARNGKVIEEVGTYDPGKKPKLFEFKQDRVSYWLGVGAQPTEPVERLLGNAGLIPKVTRKSSTKKVETPA